MNAFNSSETIGYQIAFAVRRLLSHRDANPYSHTRGCFDRRYWAWKIVDYPEATYQRNVQPLAQLWADPQHPFHHDPDLLEAVLAGLEYSGLIQHSDGSFDQAFPQEHSFAATGFLLHSLFEAHRLVCQHMGPELRSRVENCLSRAADFLCRQSEKHGFIANHVAGAALALFLSGEYFGQPRFTRRGEDILEGLLASHCKEGWFPEYDGADPGYQTLCLYYLAQIWERWPSRALEKALEHSLDFLAYFVHPDGTFAGEYGSRRTKIFYPGGLALLSREFPMALSIAQTMCRSICTGRVVTLRDMDMGNLAPLLSNYICALQANVLDVEGAAPHLPWEQLTVRQDFPEAGLYIRGTEHYYAIMGVSNGGVLKVFDKTQRRVLWDDSGYMGELSNGTHVTTQMTITDRPCTVGEDEIGLTSNFYRVVNSSPTPLQFVLLRILNLTLMRSLWIGNVVKKGLVRLLIGGKRQYAMKLQRMVRFEGSRIIVEDRLFKSPGLKIKWLEFGRKFVGIHMASASYFEGWRAEKSLPVPQIDIEQLNRQQRLDVRVVIEVSHA